VIVATFLAVVLSNSPEGALEAALRAQMEEAKAPGAAFAVVHDGRVIAARGLGVEGRGSGTAVTADTLFMVGSVTKTLTVAAVLRAAEACILDLEAPLGRSLPGLDPAVARVTLRQLVSQTSGLGDLPGEAGTTDEAALLAFARALGPAQFVAPPGAVFSYSNPGLALAGAALETARREPYAAAMRTLLFAPLGMRHTTLRLAEAAAFPRATGHTAKGERVVPWDLDTRLLPAGYAATTAENLAAFLREWLAAFEGRGRVLSRATARAMATKVSDFPPTFDGTGYGLGLFVEDRRSPPIFHHGGQSTGFSAQIVLVPERRLGLAFLANADGIVFTKTVDAALSAYAGMPALADPAPLPEGERLSEDEARPLVGRYLNRWPLELLWSEGALQLRSDGGAHEVRRLGPDRYVARGSSGAGFELRTGRDGDGTPYLRQFIWAFGRGFTPAAFP